MTLTECRCCRGNLVATEVFCTWCRSGACTNAPCIRGSNPHAVTRKHSNRQWRAHLRGECCAEEVERK